MSAVLKIYILFNFCNILIECLIPDTPNLTVRKVDKSIIERKRQDTRDMCRIFNEEIQKGFTGLKNIYNNNNRKRTTTIRRHRAKRDVTFPLQNIEDEQRVEKIVDRIYDDLLERGQNVSYKRRERPFVSAVIPTSQNEVNSNLTGRRFNFAPLELSQPHHTPATREPQIDTDRIPPRFNHAIVPYFIDANYYDSHLAEIIMKAFDYFERATCVRLQRLREKPLDKESMQNVTWLYITNPSGIRQCVHSNDKVRIKGVQMIVFGYDCMSLGNIIHEVMHILGFYHEHLRTDRDQHITILWDNIKPGYRKFFEMPKGENKKEKNYDSLPYDYDSILHFPPRAFSRNGQVTIWTKPGIKIGQRERLSELDVEKINLEYSNECVKRNRDYLVRTCPSVKRATTTRIHVSEEDIEEYFRDRIWSFGVVNYRFKDKVEFSTEELENIKSVIQHIQRETCIEFRDLTDLPSEWVNSTESDSSEGSEKYVELNNHNGTKVTLPDLLSSSEEEGNEINDEDEKKILRKKRAVPLVPQRRHRTDASSFVVFARSADPGCHCPAPKHKGKNVVKITVDCFNSVNDLLHLFVHLLGLDHQHNMYDRDNYLHISWDQITPEIEKEMKLTLPPAASVGFPYDYQSVMHYPWLQIRDGKANIMYPIWNDGWAMGHWQGLSSTDVQKLNILYSKECEKRKREAEQPKDN